MMIYILWNFSDLTSIS